MCPGTASPPTTYGGIFAKAAKQACLADAQTVQQASESYQLSHQQFAPSIGALVAPGLIRSAPSTDHGYVITYDAATGKMTAAGNCTFP